MIQLWSLIIAFAIFPTAEMTASARPAQTKPKASTPGATSVVMPTSQFPVRTMCRILEVAPSGFYACENARGCAAAGRDVL